MWGRPIWPAAGDLLHLLQGDLDPQGVQFGDDLGVALDPGLLQHRQALVQMAVAVIDAQAQDVHGAAGKRALTSTPGMTSTPILLARGHGLGQAVDGVVVSQGQGLEAPGLGQPHHLRRRKGAVRGVGVGMRGQCHFLSSGEVMDYHLAKRLHAARTRK